MPIEREGRYRGMMVQRGFKRKADGSPYMLDLMLIAQEFFDPEAADWTDMGAAGVTFDAGFYIRSFDGDFLKGALESFAEACGWDGTDEQFMDDAWKPNRIQFGVKLKPKTNRDGTPGTGFWYTLTSVVPYGSVSGKIGESAVPAEVLDALAEYRQRFAEKHANDPKPTPVTPAPSPTPTALRPPPDNTPRMPTDEEVPF